MLPQGLGVSPAGKHAWTATTGPITGRLILVIIDAWLHVTYWHGGLPMVDVVSRRRPVPWCAAAGLLLCLAGCKPSPVHSGCQGEVSYEGKPVANGQIRFFPLSGTPGPGASTTVRDGRYHVAVGPGLTAGTYLVAVMATRSTGRKLRPEPGYEAAGPVAEEESFIPERFNASSELRVTLGPGENNHDFHMPTAK